MKKILSLFILALFLLPLRPASAQAEPQMLLVSPEGPYTSLTEALTAAQAGDTIEVHGGLYPGPLLVEKSVTLVGVDWPVIDGQGDGTVVKLLAPGITFRGFLIRNSGASLDQENSGIAGEAPDLIIENNRLEDTLFGIYLREAAGTDIRGNHIQSKDLAVPRRGDPIRVWYSDHVQIVSNRVERGRDVVLWYSEHLTVRNNQVSNGRYGLHFMYCDDATIEDNLLIDNSVGAFLMYSRRMTLRHNTIAKNRGPSGFGIGLKDMDDAVVVGNLFFDNRVGAHLDNSPREVDSLGWFEGNTFGFNDIGVNLMPSVRRNQFTGNSFIDNQEQVGIGGGGQLRENEWTVAERGNYWSDYVGYDAGLDGLGDEPYRSERLFENLMDRYPNLRLFVGSPAAQAVDFAAKAVPLVKPKPKLTDLRPLMDPSVPREIPTLPNSGRGSGALAAFGLLVLGVICLIGTARLPNRLYHWVTTNHPGEKTMIQIQALTRRFGALVAVDRLSVQIPAGQSVALWGPNGAGKTTVIHCLLGLIPFEGQVVVAGKDVSTQGKAVRQAVGFVPQVLNFHHDLKVQETMEFYARLKKVPPDSIPALLARLGIQDQAAKRVGELSGGMKQRLALAISLLADPKILILDEPTSNLDIESRTELIGQLAALQAEGKTVLFSSHRLEEVIDLADRVVVLRQGQLVADCSVDRFFEESGLQARLALFVPKDRMAAAVNALTVQGYTASPNGKRIWVEVASNRKGDPINTLAQAGIPVQDFQIELIEEGLPRDS